MGSDWPNPGQRVLEIMKDISTTNLKKWKRDIGRNTRDGKKRTQWGGVTFHPTEQGSFKRLEGERQDRKPTIKGQRRKRKNKLRIDRNRWQGRLQVTWTVWIGRGQGAKETRSGRTITRVAIRTSEEVSGQGGSVTTKPYSQGRGTGGIVQRKGNYRLSEGKDREYQLTQRKGRGEMLGSNEYP